MTDARAYPRLRLTPMAYVELAQNNGGILLNVSEGGLAVQSALMLAETQLNEIRFQLPGERDWVKANARVIWMSESRKEAGVEFLNFAEESRVKVRQWMAAESARSVDVPDARATRPGKNIQRDAAKNSAPLSPDLTGSQLKRPDVVRGTLFPAGPTPEPLGKGANAAPAAAIPAVETHNWAESWAFQLDAKHQPQWAQPIARQGSWRGWTLLSIAIAVLFFVLGATVGRGSVDFAVNYITTLRLNMTKPSPPSAPAQAEPPADSGSDGAAQAAGANSSNDAGASSSNPDSAAASSGSTPGAPSAATDAQQTAPRNGAGAPANTAASAAAGAGASAGAASTDTGASAGAGQNPGAALPPNGVAAQPAPLPKPAPKQKPIQDSSSDSYAAQDLKDLGRTMLVTAPEPGSPPYRVALPDEAVSASPTVAISSRRSFRVPVLPGPRSTRSERVMIGKLISHGEPFYPAEARRKRVEGTVEIRATIGPRGEVNNMDIVSGPPELVSAALTAIREWRYEPTFIDGDPIQLEDDITVVFRLP